MRISVIFYLYGIVFTIETPTHISFIELWNTVITYEGKSFINLRKRSRNFMSFAIALLQGNGAYQIKIKLTQWTWTLSSILFFF